MMLSMRAVPKLPNSLLESAPCLSTSPLVAANNSLLKSDIPGLNAIDLGMSFRPGLCKQ